MLHTRRGFGTLCLLLSLWLGVGPPALACSVPVFRYALERWPVDAYRVVVFHRGKLAEADQAIVDRLTKAGTLKDGPRRAIVLTVDLDGDPPKGALELWKTQRDTKLPWMVIDYPRWARIQQPMWAGRLDAKVADGLLDSPARKDLAKRLLDGDTAVWLLLEGGNKAKDDAAAKLLDSELKKLTKELNPPEPPAAADPPAKPGDDKKPPVAVEVIGAGPWDDPTAPVLRVGFSVLRLARTDKRERMLVQMLLSTEEDLKDLKGPMAFAVFGRARMLPGLIDKGINAENILDVCAFLAGPCACQVKAMAPGIDLLTLTDWDRALERMMDDEPDEPPPLIGIPGPDAIRKPPTDKPDKTPDDPMR